jgi:hypothetical protein
MSLVLGWGKDVLRPVPDYCGVADRAVIQSTPTSTMSRHDSPASADEIDHHELLTLFASGVMTPALRIVPKACLAFRFL